MDLGLDGMEIFRSELRDFSSGALIATTATSGRVPSHLDGFNYLMANSLCLLVVKPA